MAISSDKGKTWNTSSPIVSRGGIQPALIERGNGELVALMRDNGDEPGNIKMSISGNGGLDWTPAEKISIPNPGSSVEMLKLKDGRLILVCNDLAEGRYKLSLYMSADDGNTWKFSGWIDNDSSKRDGFSYPAVIQGSDGRIHVTYSKHAAEKGKTIQHVSINPGQISTGR
jgi:predicted neuraminidase